MMAVAFFSWWYGAGWLSVARWLRDSLGRIGLAFSVPALLRTLFEPWRRIITYPGASLGDHVRAMLDNLVSRGIGFVVRLLVLLAAVGSVVIVVVFGVIVLLAWPLLPFVPLMSLVKGIIG